MFAVFAVVCTADNYFPVTFLVLLFFFSVSCHLTNKDEYVIQKVVDEF